MKKHTGSCHCGAVQFEVEIDLDRGGARCNCTICAKIGAPMAQTKPAAFRLLEGAQSLTPYIWGGKISTRYFCKRCGVHCYGAGYLEVIGGDFVSVNLNALDGVDVQALPNLVWWDGRNNNWMAGPRHSPWPICTDAEPSQLAPVDHKPATQPSANV